MSEITIIYKLLLILSLIISVCTIPLNLRNIDNTAEKNSINEEESDVFGLKGESKHKFEEYLTKMLELYYDEVIAPNLTQTENKAEWKKYEMRNGTWDYGKYFDQQENKEKMQSDIPSSDVVANMNNGSESLKNIMATLNKNNMNVSNSFLNAPKNFTSAYEQMRAKNLEAAFAESNRIQWLQYLQKNILQSTGRVNTTISSTITNPVMDFLNRSGTVQMQPKDTEIDNIEYINKKIRSFYPSCDMPRNTDEEVWKDVNSMNLLFNVDYTSQTVNTGTTDGQNQEDNVNIASATLRLYRLPQESNGTSVENCKTGANNAISDDDKQIRVSIYWYLRVLKKHKVVKRKLADSRMVPMYEPRIQVSGPINPSSHYVEFNVRPAAKTWVRGRNWGLAVVVEDMDGTILNTGKYFKGVACDTVGNVSTPIPIPTAFFDANPEAFRLGQSANGTKSIAGLYDRLLPKLDICTVEFAPGQMGANNMDNSKLICKMLKSVGADNKKTHHDTTKVQAGKSEGRHIRHQHQQHHLTTDTDFRDNIVSKTVVMTNSQLQQLNLQNISSVNR